MDGRLVRSSVLGLCAARARAVLCGVVRCGVATLLDAEKVKLKNLTHLTTAMPLSSLPPP